MNVSIGLNGTASQDVCRLPLLPITLGPGTLQGFEAESFCLPPCCVPCPPQDTFFPQYVRFFRALDVVNLVSLILVLIYCFLWIGVLYRCPKTRVRSRYVVGTAVALVFWHIPGFITLIANPKRVLCENDITRASGSHRLCAAQGFIFVFSTHAVVLWGGLRIAYVHLQMRKSSKFYLQYDIIINNLIAWGISLIFATVALALGDIGYVTSHYCGPSLEKGQAILWIPLLVYISISSFLQIWTLLEIAEAVSKAYYPENLEERSEDRRVSGAFDNLPSPSIHLGTRSEITDFSMEGTAPTQSEITEASATTCNSETPLNLGSRFSRLDYLRTSHAMNSRRTTFLFNAGIAKPVGDFSRTLKDRGKFLWELFKLNYRMLISLTLTLFVAIFISVNSLLFQNSIYNLPNSTEAFINWMGCMQTEGNTAEICSIMADDLFPLSFWRNVTADTARATFGTIFFIVEITKGDFWRALKERHPFALTFARGPRKGRGASEVKDMGPVVYPSARLPPILPNRISFSFIRRQSSKPQQSPTRPGSLISNLSLQSPELSHQRNSQRLIHNHTFPRSYYQNSASNSPRIYLHTPQCEIDGDERIIREYRRRMSLPSPRTLRSFPSRTVPGSRESSAPTSTRASLRSMATDVLVLESRLERAEEES